MYKLYLIGLGTGNLRQITLEAIECIRECDVFFIFEKESEKNRELVELREKILTNYASKKARKVHLKIPERKRVGLNREKYINSVESWRIEKAKLLAEAIKRELMENETGGILIWGDPSLYDGHIEVMEYIRNNMISDINYEVIPGISSIQVLTSRFKISLNRIADTIEIMTGRNLLEMQEGDIKNAVILLDNYMAYRKFKDSDLVIYWGAYLGTEKEIKISGKLKDVVDEIIERRQAERSKNGWIMETYILRREK